MRNIPFFILLGLPITQITLDLLSIENKGSIENFLNWYNSEKANKVKLFTFVGILFLFVRPDILPTALYELSILTTLLLLPVKIIDKHCSFLPSLLRKILKNFLPSILLATYIHFFMNPFTSTLCLTLALAGPALFTREILFKDFSAVQDKYTQMINSVLAIFSKKHFNDGLRNNFNSLKLTIKETCIKSFSFAAALKTNLEIGKFLPMMICSAFLAKNSATLLILAAFQPMIYLALTSSTLLSISLNPKEPFLILKYLGSCSLATLKVLKESIKDAFTFSNFIKPQQASQQPSAPTPVKNNQGSNNQLSSGNDSQFSIRNLSNLRYPKRRRRRSSSFS